MQLVTCVLPTHIFELNKVFAWPGYDQIINLVKKLYLFIYLSDFGQK